MKFVIYFFFVLSTCVLLSCTDEDVLSGGQGPSGTQEYNISFNVPEPMLIQTRGSNDDSREKSVSKITLLFFQENGGVFSYHSAASSGSIINTSAGTARTRIALPFTQGGNNTFKIAAIANSAKEDSEFDKQLSGKTIDALYTELISEETGPNMPTSNFLMSGFTNEGNTVTLLSESHVLDFKLERNVARFDIYAKNVEAKFRVLTAEVRNARGSSYIFKKESNLSDVTFPASSSLENYLNESTDRRDKDENNIPINQITQKLYAYENNTEKKPELDKTTCLIIGGQYYEGGQWRSITYYRLDIGYLEAGDWQYKVKRNHKYNINISDVQGQGYPTKDDAYRNEAQNVDFDITVWNTSDMSNIVFNGSKGLAVDKTVIAVGPTQVNMVHKVKLTHTTSIPASGWTVSSSDDWVSIPANSILRSDTGEGEFDILVTSALPSNLISREATVTVAAGELKLYIKVNQSKYTSEVSIDLDPKRFDVDKQGLPDYSPSTSALPEQILAFTPLSGVDIAKSTYTVYPSINNEDWLRVKTLDGQSPTDIPLASNANKVMLEMDALPEAESFRSGIVVISINDPDRGRSTFHVPVTQARKTAPSISFPAEILISGHSGTNVAYNNFEILSNVPWYLDLGKAEVEKWIDRDASSGLEGGIGKTNTSIKYNFSYYQIFEVFRETVIHAKELATGKTISKGYLYVQNPMLIIGGSQMNSGNTLVTLNILPSGKYFYIFKGVHQNFTSPYYPGVFYWGTNVSNTGVHELTNPTAWNKGTELLPEPGEADPSPAGFRIPTKTEYEELIKPLAISGKIVAATAQGNSSSSYQNLVKAEWCSTVEVDNQGRVITMYRFHWGDYQVHPDEVKWADDGTYTIDWYDGKDPAKQVSNESYGALRAIYNP